MRLFVCSSIVVSICLLSGSAFAGTLQAATYHKGWAGQGSACYGMVCTDLTNAIAANQTLLNGCMRDGLVAACQVSVDVANKALRVPYDEYKARRCGCVSKQVVSSTALTYYHTPSSTQLCDMIARESKVMSDRAGTIGGLGCVTSGNPYTVAYYELKWNDTSNVFPPDHLVLAKAGYFIKETASIIAYMKIGGGNVFLPIATLNEEKHLRIIQRAESASMTLLTNSASTTSKVWAHFIGIETAAGGDVGPTTWTGPSYIKTAFVNVYFKDADLDNFFKIQGVTLPGATAPGVFEYGISGGVRFATIAGICNTAASWKETRGCYGITYTQLAATGVLPIPMSCPITGCR